MPTEPSPIGLTFYTFEDTAALLGVTVSWLKKRVRDNEIPFTRLSARVVRFTPADIEAITAAARVEAKAKPAKSTTPTPSKRGKAA